MGCFGKLRIGGLAYVLLISCTAVVYTTTAAEKREPGVKETEHKQSVSHAISVIRTWRDVIPFVDEIVMYQATADYFKGKENLVGNNLYAGYIKPRVGSWNLGKGYVMAKLLT